MDYLRVRALGCRTARYAGSGQRPYECHDHDGFLGRDGCRQPDLEWFARYYSPGSTLFTAGGLILISLLLYAPLSINFTAGVSLTPSTLGQPKACGDLS